MNRLLPVGLFATMFLGLCAYVWPYMVDDAFVVSRYARNVLEGAGYGFNAGTATDGITGPLWLLPALLGESLGHRAPLFQKLVGVACAVVAVGCAWWWSTSAYLRGIYVLAFCLVQSNLVVWSVAGLETGLATLLATGAFLGAVGTGFPPAAVSATRQATKAFPSWPAMLCAAALATLRPESIPFCFLVAAWIGRAQGLRGVGIRLLPIVLAVALVATWRVFSFGTPLPLSYFAKVQSWNPQYALTGLALMTGILALPLVVACAIRDIRWQRGNESLIGLSLVTTWTAAVAIAGGDWMPGFRILVPMIPAIAWLLGLAFSRSTQVGRLLLILSLAVPLLDACVQLPRAREAGLRRMKQGGRLVNRIEHHARGETVALVDIGFVGYQTGFPVFDLAGITDPKIGRAPGGHVAKQIDIGMLESADLSLIVVHSSRPVAQLDSPWPAVDGHPIENWLYTQPWTRANFSVAEVIHYAPGYDYVLLTRSRAADAKISPSSR